MQLSLPRYQYVRHTFALTRHIKCLFYYLHTLWHVSEDFILLKGSICFMSRIPVFTRDLMSGWVWHSMDELPQPMAESLLCELEAEAGGKKHTRVSVLLICVLSQQKEQKVLRLHVFLHVNCYRLLGMETWRALGVPCAVSFTDVSVGQSLHFYRI